MSLLLRFEHLMSHKGDAEVVVFTANIEVNVW